jgi:hypothetical protein
MVCNGGGEGRGAAKTSTYNLHSLFSFVKYVSSTKSAKLFICSNDQWYWKKYLLDWSKSWSVICYAKIKRLRVSLWENQTSTIESHLRFGWFFNMLLGVHNIVYHKNFSSIGSVFPRQKLKIPSRFWWFSKNGFSVNFSLINIKFSDFTFFLFLIITIEVLSFCTQSFKGLLQTLRVLEGF